MNRAKQPNFRGFCCQIVLWRAQEAVQHMTDALLAVPLQLFQAIPNGMVLVPMGHQRNRLLDALVVGEPVGLLHVQEDVVQIVVGEVVAVPRPGHLPCHRHPAGQHVELYGIPEQRVFFQHHHAVGQSLGHGSVLVAVKFLIDCVNRHERLRQLVHRLLVDIVPSVFQILLSSSIGSADVVGSVCSGSAGAAELARFPAVLRSRQRSSPDPCQRSDKRGQNPWR